MSTRYPNRPRNHSKTLPFHDLYTTLFDPLSDNKKKPTGPVAARKKQGPHGPQTLTPNEARRHIIEKFIMRWRNEVGDDIYPAFRLIVPEKDRERAMYGLKEKTIGKLLVRIIKIDKNSDDAFNLLNWKLPGQGRTSMVAGDFAGRCHAVLSKRSLRSQPGDMTIAEVNQQLNMLSLAPKEDEQLPIMEDFYKRMNADEMMWLIRMILRQMKVGATEKTFFDIWHPDADTLFNISSNLRRVCWELSDPSIRLEGEETDITLMECFQPQLAQFQMHSFEKMVQRMRPVEGDDEFWIEDKLDGERMQLHMVEDDNVAGGKRFGFWSRKAKDYKYLYGTGLEDNNSALTRHLKGAFDEKVRNVILDGEMITWDPELDRIVPFGTLKTAALSEQKDPFGGKGQRPLFRVFDILYLNDVSLTRYTLRDRRAALMASVKPVHRRLEIHDYTVARKPSDIEPLLRKVVAEASEGLVLKSPRSAYRLNERNDDWMKVKPEYMTEFGEALDCVVVGGYYGSGRRGGYLSSFMCGLRVDNYIKDKDAAPSKCWSFFKVGGGMAASDYQAIRHHTEGKWHDWDRANPPKKYLELAGGDKQFEQPDAWIRPEDSLVFEVKAASVHTTDLFRTNLTLRFPRFKRIRTDRDWKSALSIQGFLKLKNTIENEQHDKDFELEQKRKRAPKRQKTELTVAGVTKTFGTSPTVSVADGVAKLFSGLTFFVISDGVSPLKRTKSEIESLIKRHGGELTNTVNSKAEPKKHENTICIADRRVVKAMSLQKSGKHSIVRPSWLFDCVRQAEKDVSMGRKALLLPWEPRHVFFVAERDQSMIAAGADEYADGYARDIDDSNEMRQLLDGMADPPQSGDSIVFLQQLEDRGSFDQELPGWMFRRCVVYFHGKTHQPEFTNGTEHTAEAEPSAMSLDLEMASSIVRFAGGTVVEGLNDKAITHIVVEIGSTRLRELRETMTR